MVTQSLDAFALTLQPEEELQITKFLVDRATNAVFWVNSDAQFLYINDAGCCMAGYSREELLSITMHYVNPDFSAKVWSEYWRTIKQQGSLYFESSSSKFEKLGSVSRFRRC